MAQSRHTKSQFVTVLAHVFKPKRKTQKGSRLRRLPAQASIRTPTVRSRDGPRCAARCHRKGGVL